MIHPDAAAIDIGSTMHMAAVNPSTCDMPERAFGTFTRDLNALADWLRECGVTSVAMESTWTCRVYIPVSELIYAAFRSNAKGLLPPGDEGRRRGL